MSSGQLAFSTTLTDVTRARAIYADEIESIAKWISEVAESPHLDADADKVFSALILLHRRNLDAFDRKLSAPSSQVELEADGDAFGMVQSFVDAANIEADHQTN